jgi:hypothetical protein
MPSRGRKRSRVGRQFVSNSTIIKVLSPGRGSWDWLKTEGIRVGRYRALLKGGAVERENGNAADATPSQLGISDFELDASSSTS